MVVDYKNVCARLFILFSVREVQIRAIFDNNGI